jgi:hypothetical protein
MATTMAPFLRASRIDRHRWGFVDSTFAPQRTTSFERRSVSGSIPTRLSPSVYPVPNPPAIVQMVMA